MNAVVTPRSIVSTKIINIFPLEKLGCKKLIGANDIAPNRLKKANTNK